MANLEKNWGESDGGANYVTKPQLTLLLLTYSHYSTKLPDLPKHLNVCLSKCTPTTLSQKTQQSSVKYFTSSCCAFFCPFPTTPPFISMQEVGFS